MPTVFYKILHKFDTVDKRWTFVICNQRYNDYRQSDYLDVTNQAANSINDCLTIVIPKAIQRLKLHQKQMRSPIKCWGIEIIE